MIIQSIPILKRDKKAYLLLLQYNLKTQMNLEQFAPHILNKHEVADSIQALEAEQSAIQERLDAIERELSRCDT